MKFSILSKSTTRRKKKMKIRTGFVSNSSSSSFVLTNKTGKTMEIYGHDLGDISKIVRTKEELDGYIINRFGWGSYPKLFDECGFPTLENIFKDQEWLKKDIYDHCIETINRGWAVFFCECSWQGIPPESKLSEIVAEKGLPYRLLMENGFIVIQTDDREDYEPPKIKNDLTKEMIKKLACNLAGLEYIEDDKNES